MEGFVKNQESKYTRSDVINKRCLLLDIEELGELISPTQLLSYKTLRKNDYDSWSSGYQCHQHKTVSKANSWKAR